MEIFARYNLVCALLLTAIGINTAIATTFSKPSKIDWQPCFQDTAQAFECATVQVPLKHSQDTEKNQLNDDSVTIKHYDNQNQTMISLALVRLPATAPKRRIGSLFLNPGGPGGSGVNFVLGAGPILYTNEVRARFDLVGFDPRGIGRSTALTCFRTEADLRKVLDQPAFPVTSDEQLNQQSVDLFYAEQCSQNAEPIINYMTTADAAKDLDMLREMVGDSQLNFVGYSYGSFLGVTYANLFPNRVRTMVVDGVLDPIAWSTGRDSENAFIPITTRLHSDAGAIDTLNEFFRLCDIAGIAHCKFANNSEDRFEAIAKSLRNEPLVIVSPDGSKKLLTYSKFISFTLNTMYNSATWAYFADILLGIEENLPAEQLGNRLYNLQQALGMNKQSNLAQSIEGFTGVLCTDSDNPDFFYAWPFAAELSEDQYGYFAPLWTWASSPCLNWPGSKKQRYSGPFNRETANPILVASTRYDPATRYESAVIVNELMPNSGLLTVEGWGHTTLFTSRCATETVANYLLKAQLPNKQIVCQADEQPFPNTTTASYKTSQEQNNRSLIMQHLIPEHLKRLVQ